MATAWNLSKSFDYHGQSVAYDTFGEGDSVVLVHGTPFSSYVWRNIARELARDHKVYVFGLLATDNRKNQKARTYPLASRTPSSLPSCGIGTLHDQM